MTPTITVDCALSRHLRPTAEQIETAVVHWKHISDRSVRRRAGVVEVELCSLSHPLTFRSFPDDSVWWSTANHD